MISRGTDNTSGYPTLINCAEWTDYIKNLFNHVARQIYLNHTSPSTLSNRHPTKKFTPPYGLRFANFTDDVGVVDKKARTRTIDARIAPNYITSFLLIIHRIGDATTEDNAR
jgi:hypothetical protein